MKKHTTTLRTHDSNHGIGKATVGEVGLVDEIVESSNIEVAVAINELRDTAIIFHGSTVSTFRIQVSNQVQRQGLLWCHSTSYYVVLC